MDKQSILLVDDELLIRRALEYNLQREGFDVRSAEDGEQALAILQERSFGLVLTDYLMEGMNGIELMKLARKLYPQIKVIIFSGYEDKGSTDEILGLGADDFLCKPINFNDLLERILSVLKFKAPSS